LTNRSSCSSIGIELAKTKTVKQKTLTQVLSLELPYRQQERSVISHNRREALYNLIKERISRQWHHFYHKYTPTLVPLGTAGRILKQKEETNESKR
jgi:hypothetical protein